MQTARDGGTLGQAATSRTIGRCEARRGDDHQVRSVALKSASRAIWVAFTHLAIFPGLLSGAPARGGVVNRGRDRRARRLVRRAAAGQVRGSRRRGHGRGDARRLCRTTPAAFFGSPRPLRGRAGLRLSASLARSAFSRLPSIATRVRLTHMGGACPRCRYIDDRDANYCSNCGAPRPMGSVRRLDNLLERVPKAVINTIFYSSLVLFAVVVYTFR